MLELIDEASRAEHIAANTLERTEQINLVLRLTQKPVWAEFEQNEFVSLLYVIVLRQGEKGIQRLAEDLSALPDEKKQQILEIVNKQKESSIELSEGQQTLFGILDKAFKSNKRKNKHWF